MYQEALSKHHSDSLKNAEMPPSCNPNQLNWMEFASYKFSRLFSGKLSEFYPIFYCTIFMIMFDLLGEDECEKYAQVLFTDPVYKISPITALSDTLATLVFHPLGYIGGQLGDFFNNFFSKNESFFNFIGLMNIELSVYFFVSRSHELAQQDNCNSNFYPAIDYTTGFRPRIRNSSAPLDGQSETFLWTKKESRSY